MKRETRRRSLLAAGISIALLALACAAQATDPVDVVTTTDGKTFHHVTVTSVKGDKVLLNYQDADGGIGAALVALDKLPDNARKALGLRTRVEQAAIEAKQAALKAEQEAFEAEQTKKGLVKYGKEWVTPEEKKRREEAKADAEVQKLIDAHSLRGVTYKVSQAMENGSLCYLDDYQFFVYGLTNEDVNDDEFHRSDLYFTGRHYSYTTVSGAARTVPALACKRDLAIKIMKEESNTVPNSPPQTTSGGLDNARGLGTGFAITEDGYIITAYHVIRDAKSIRVKTETELQPAEVVASDPDNDLALLKVNKKTESVTFSSARTGSLGQTVFTVGFPMPDLQGFSAKVTKGVISGMKGIKDDVRNYQIDASVQPGNSGGPLADERGNVLGVVVARINSSAVLEASGGLPQNVNYAVKLAYLLALVDANPEVAKKIHVAKDDEAKVSFEEAVEKVRKATVIIASY